ncbi:hypothetical protein ACFQWB_00265 [Paenibacillus thermoaerophilus]|uniref:Uncharacterized protein n=1 Tax=Paenibacillus thermoaerophilus TaxID=1215385 RepID=A0ABW2V275_9BACL|nr:hypothetical protein [Paenibacillus thermoaerophilus]TMV15875.1 hypothetical protein FE781_09795 [Paenibacillus thermoaerophilus]
MRSTANPAPAAARRNVPYFKSIAFKVSGIAALCFILLGSLMAYISYSQQKALICGNLTEKEKMFHFPLASEIERIEKAKSELKKDPDAYKKDPDIINLQYEMDRYASIENVENAYLFYPEWLDVDGEKALLNLLSNADLYETEKPAAPYVLDDELFSSLLCGERPTKWPAASNDSASCPRRSAR